VGDVLRDSAGRATTLQAFAFDEASRPATSPSLRFVYVPTRRDSLQRLIQDSALVVDSLTGAVTARATFVASQGVVAVRVGDRLQVVDTIQIVPRPDSARADTAVTFPLRFDCADTSRVISPRPLAPLANGIDTLYAFNAIGPFRVLVRGDSAASTGTARVPVRQRLVRWRVDSGLAVPTVRIPGGGPGDTIPAIGLVGRTGDRITGLDTTDASGLSAVRLRVRPFALTRSVVAADAFTVRLRAIAQPGPVAIRAERADTVFFRARLQRRPGATCP
jgi:hypothetical protein